MKKLLFALLLIPSLSFAEGAKERLMTLYAQKGELTTMLEIYQRNLAAINQEIANILSTPVQQVEKKKEVEKKK